MNKIAVFGLLVVCAVGAGALEVPLHRGVNLTGWFQTDQVRRIPVSRFGPRDFADLTTLGVDVVRLPVNLTAYTGGWPGYRIDPLLFELLDRAVGGLLTEGFTVVLDNHSDFEDPKLGLFLEPFLRAVWTQLAVHYKDRSLRLLFEIQNEPHDIKPADWDRVQRAVLADIRKIDPTRTVVVTGADWGGIAGMTALPAYQDPNLVYSFHFYDPFLFTHQGADWTDLSDLEGVSFPPRGSPPEVPEELEGTWVEDELAAYYESDAEARLAADLDRAAAFARDRGVRVWCGEWGVFSEADPADRVVWYDTVRSLLDDRNIPWTTWDYRDSFGLFVPGSAEAFDQDLNLPLVGALGFQAPVQRPPGPRKMTSGFGLYGDQWDEGADPQVWLPRGTADFYDGDRPAQGRWSLRLAQWPRYGSVSWSFAPWKDLSALAETGAVSFQARASTARFSFEVRFVDGETDGPNGLPWRRAFTVDQSLLPGDGQWHRVVVPLAKLRESGAWDGEWHDPVEGAFDWSRVGSFQIVAEASDLGNTVLGIDALEVISSAP